MIQKLPLFPLNAVLFPHTSLSLHIFEERYRLMIGRCLEQNSPFGAVLIRQGNEVSGNDPWVRQQRKQLGLPDDGSGDAGADVIPYAVGATALIRESQRLPDGRYYLTVIGQRRFRIQYIAQRQPYLVASISYLPEESGAAVSEQADELRALYTRYLAAIRAATGQQSSIEPPPADMIELTYWMAHRMRVDNIHKQRWLEADVATRLREMAASLRSELALLPGAAPDQHEREWGGLGSWN